ncbi:MAG: SurA N-terminal domain-containing protein [Thermodesulfobacteriota bacterium]
MRTIQRRSPGFGRQSSHVSSVTLLIVWIALQGPASLTSCSKTPPQPKEKALLRVGNHVVTVLDFNQALELAKTAYPHNAMQNPKTAGDIKIRLLGQLTEELVLLAKAGEMNIRITDEELEKAVKEIRKDYPDKTFEDTFLENAVSYESWKEQLRRRLLMEKVVAVAYEAGIQVTAGEIAGYYKEHFREETAELFSEQDVRDKIIREIRRQKAEAGYTEWVESIRNQYPVKLNQKLWQTIMEG